MEIGQHLSYFGSVGRAARKRIAAVGQKRRPLQYTAAPPLPQCPVSDRDRAALQYLARGQQKTSFDDLVGSHEERRRDRKAKRFGGSHVDDEVEARGTLKR